MNRIPRGMSCVVAAALAIGGFTVGTLNAAPPERPVNVVLFLVGGLPPPQSWKVNFAYQSSRSLLRSKRRFQTPAVL
jgi:hypothetical protein